MQVSSLTNPIVLAFTLEQFLAIFQRNSDELLSHASPQGNLKFYVVRIISCNFRVRFYAILIPFYENR